MAQWQYRTLSTELDHNNFDEELQKLLKDYGIKGWELVQILQPRSDALYHFVLRLKDRWLRVSSRHWRSTTRNRRNMALYQIGLSTLRAIVASSSGC